MICYAFIDWLFHESEQKAIFFSKQQWKENENEKKRELSFKSQWQRARA